MDHRHVNNSGSGVLHGLSSIGARAAAATVRPLARPVGAAAEAGIGLPRLAIDRLLESGELEHVLASPRVQAAVAQVLDSDGAKLLVDAFFDSPLFDRVIDRLLASDGLWHLIDEVAGSPAVLAALSKQGLSFADQLGAVVRRRSRGADDRLEHATDRIIRRQAADRSVGRAAAG